MDANIISVLETTPIDVWFTISAFFEFPEDVENLIKALFSKSRSIKFISFKQIYQKLTKFKNLNIVCLKSDLLEKITISNSSKERQKIIISFYYYSISDKEIIIDDSQYLTFWKYVIDWLNTYHRNININFVYSNLYNQTYRMIKKHVDLDSSRFPPELIIIFCKLLKHINFKTPEIQSQYICELIKSASFSSLGFYYSFESIIAMVKPSDDIKIAIYINRIILEYFSVGVCDHQLYERFYPFLRKSVIDKHNRSFHHENGKCRSIINYEDDFYEQFRFDH